MAFDDGAKTPASLVAHSPVVKRQRTANGYNSPSTSANNTDGYNSANDDATVVPDTPGDRYQTQPTQLLPQGSKLRSSSPDTPEIFVQVPVSSPISGREVTPNPSRANGRVPQNNGSVPTNLAKIMAPAGTSFRSPVAINLKPFPPVADDGEPRYYQEISSDEENTKDLANIKPTKFVSGSANSSFGAPVSPSKDARDGVNGNSRFQSILATSAYQGPANRKPASLSSGYGALKKPQAQNGPSRAQPVHTIPENLSDVVKKQLEHIRSVMPSKSKSTAYAALQRAKFNVDGALTILLDEPEVITIGSDDEIESPQSMKKANPQLKHVQVPVASISERYSSMHSRSKQQITAATPLKPKKRLVQGRKDPSSPAVPPLTSPLKPIVAEAYDSDPGSESASGAEDGEDDRSSLEARVLAYLKECTLEDLIDTTHFSEADAQIMLDARPLKSIEAAREVGRKGKGKRMPLGDKIVEKCIDMFKSFDAVGILETNCADLSEPAIKEMAGWGLDILGASTKGELELTSLEGADTSQVDSGLGSPSSRDTFNNGDEDIKGPVTKRKRKVALLEQPETMAKDYPMKDYQIVGLNWLALMYKYKLSCILADDMGLGKTCQVISFLTHLVENGRTGPHIVVCPASTLENWLREFQKFSPDLKVDPYHGGKEMRGELAEMLMIGARAGDNEEHKVHVIVTTYEMANKKDDAKFLRRLGADVCVYDEGHLLKNPSTARYKGLMTIKANFRLLLTGTPLQNNLREMVALLAFILPQVFVEVAEDLNFIFQSKTTTKDTNHKQLLSQQRIDRARNILKPFVLRRKKQQVLKDLPDKTYKVVKATMHEDQKTISETFLEAMAEREVAKKEAKEAVDARKDGEKRAKRVPKKASKTDEEEPLEKNEIMQLRKAAIHPLLFRRWFTEDKIQQMAKILRAKEPVAFNPSLNIEHLLQELRNASDFGIHSVYCSVYPCIAKFDIPDLAWMNSGKVDTLVELVQSYKANGDRALVFSQFSLVLDILEAVLNTIGIDYVRIDGATSVDVRQTMIDSFYDNEDITVFLLTTKAGGTGINLVAANKVIIFDSSFNPQDDVQAGNRAHRVGQTRDVEVVTIVTEGTIEESILAMGKSKLELDREVAGGGEESEQVAEEVNMQAVTDAFLNTQRMVVGGAVTAGGS
ncbi:uncharacterized protein LY89DRAFT_777602 [Mollisia scopiformis]|uniref:DNA helicase n=1 Tax=Mollisia scopiformis TaxID=149040 RepID=A0A194XQG4_MOLSC|nr:uncharacterized protein LY89DRAFT_777602 [Mollisia scopiformis]KUJ22505.1 hypothetical protein LY89DRAFT_777602 [Mollisia scopiformis]